MPRGSLNESKQEKIRNYNWPLMTSGSEMQTRSSRRREIATEDALDCTITLPLLRGTGQDPDPARGAPGDPIRGPTTDPTGTDLQEGKADIVEGKKTRDVVTIADGRATIFKTARKSKKNEEIGRRTARQRLSKFRRNGEGTRSNQVIVASLRGDPTVIGSLLK